MRLTVVDWNNSHVDCSLKRKKTKTSVYDFPFDIVRIVTVTNGEWIFNRVRYYCFALQNSYMLCFHHRKAEHHNHEYMICKNV